VELGDGDLRRSSTRVEAPNRGGAMGAPPWRLGEERGRVGEEMDKEREERRLSSG